MTEKEMALLVHYSMRNHAGAMALKEGKESEVYKRFYKSIKDEKKNVIVNFRKHRSVAKDLYRVLGKNGRFFDESKYIKGVE